MINKKILIVTVVLVIGAILTLVVDQILSYKAVDARTGKVVFDIKLQPQVEKISISKSNLNVDLRRTPDGQWKIDSGGGFPADATKIANFMDLLSKTKFHGDIKNIDAEAATFGLDIPTKLTLASASQDIFKLEMGSTRKGGGQYARIPGEKKGYLLDGELRAQADEDSWELKTLLDLKKEQVKKIEFSGEGKSQKPLTLAREKAEDKLKLIDTPKKGKIKDSAVENMDTLFMKVDFKAKYDPSNEEAKTALASPSKVKITLFDGRTYEALTGSVGNADKKKYFLKISGQKGTDQLKPDDETQLNQLNYEMSKWAFEVPEYVAKKFQKSLDDFLEKK